MFCRVSDMALTQLLHMSYEDVRCAIGNNEDSVVWKMLSVQSSMIWCYVPAFVQYNITYICILASVRLDPDYRYAIATSMWATATVSQPFQFNDHR